MLFRFALLYVFIEIALFVLLGSRIGVWPTLLWVGGGFLIGGLLFKRSGGKLGEISRTPLKDISPGEVSPSILGMLGGALIFLPGYFTDFIGFLLSIPVFRNMLVSTFSGHFERVRQRFEGRFKPQPQGQPTIEIVEERHYH